MTNTMDGTKKIRGIPMENQKEKPMKICRAMS